MKMLIEEERINACIVIISSRDKCIKVCLESLWDNYNHRYDYPVYVHYFDDIYESEEFRNEIWASRPQNVIFKQVPYKIPGFIKEHELYYNRKNLWYVRNNFPASRKGYLHMCNFTSNMYGYENTELEIYDYVMTHDDECGYTRQMPYDPFQILKQDGLMFGAYFVGQRLKDGAPHQGHLDTRIGLWKLTKLFIEKHGIHPKSESLSQLLEEPNAENKFHYLEWCDTYVINTSMFKSELWKKWINSVNKSGGVYRFRWGDNEIISIFAHMVCERLVKIPAIDDGIHDQGRFRNLQNFAPSVKK